MAASWPSNAVVERATPARWLARWPDGLGWEPPTQLALEGRFVIEWGWAPIKTIVATGGCVLGWASNDFARIVDGKLALSKAEGRAIPASAVQLTVSVIRATALRAG